MRKIFLGLVLLTTVLGLASCGSNDKPAEEVTVSEPAEDGTAVAAAASKSNDEAVAKALAEDKSTINALDIDPKDTSFTARTKSLFVSDENGKKLAVVFGLKAKDNGVAIIQVEGEQPVKLNQVPTPAGTKGAFSSGATTLTRMENSVQLDENGEVVTYKEIK